MVIENYFFFSPYKIKVEPMFKLKDCYSPGKLSRISHEFNNDDKEKKKSNMTLVFEPGHLEDSVGGSKI